MSYLKHEPVTVTKLTCSHPDIRKIWEWGGSSLNSTDKMVHVVELLFHSDAEKRKSFEIENNDYSEVEKYLENL